MAEYIFDDAHNMAIEPPSGPVSDFPPMYITNEGGSRAAEVMTRTGTTQELYDVVQVLLGSCVKLFYEADDLLKKSENDDGRWDPEGLRRRIVFVMNRHEVAEKMQRLEDQKARLGDVRMSLFLRLVLEFTKTNLDYNLTPSLHMWAVANLQRQIEKVQCKMLCSSRLPKHSRRYNAS